jgi:hypothetical protein
MKRRRKVLAEVDSFQDAPDKAPSFTFPLRDRFLQEGVSVKLICTVDAKPTPTVRTLHRGRYFTVDLQAGMYMYWTNSCKFSNSGQSVQAMFDP